MHRARPWVLPKNFFFCSETTSARRGNNIGAFAWGCRCRLCWPSGRQTPRLLVVVVVVSLLAVLSSGDAMKLISKEISREGTRT
jgi:hypothetical protein